MHRLLIILASAAWAGSVAAGATWTPRSAQPLVHTMRPGPLFVTSHDCMACHNSLTLSSGEDVSIGVSWRATIMANSSRDPYWQASVRREVIDHPLAADEIQDECSICHMPMARTEAAAAGRKGQVFAHLPIGRLNTDEARLAADGVSCTVCHQITRAKLGTRESFTGGYVIDTATPFDERPVFGPFAVDAGRMRVMHSSRLPADRIGARAPVRVVRHVPHALHGIADHGNLAVVRLGAERIVVVVVPVDRSRACEGTRLEHLASGV